MCFCRVRFCKALAKKGNEQHNAAVIGGELCTAVQNYATGSTSTMFIRACAQYTQQCKSVQGYMYNVRTNTSTSSFVVGPKKRGTGQTATPWHSVLLSDST